jgi:chromosome segregation ATPase
VSAITSARLHRVDSQLSSLRKGIVVERLAGAWLCCSRTSETPTSPFTAEDIAHVARYHRRNHSNQVSDLAADLSVADLSRTGMQLEIDQLVHDKTEVERKYEREKLARIELEEELEAERRAGVQKNQAMRAMTEEIAKLKQQVSLARTGTTRANDRVSRLNEMGLPRPPAEPEGDQSPTAGKQQVLRHTGSLKEPRLASMVQPAKSREAEEVDRLNKVIEGLKTVQDELLAKVEDWRQVSRPMCSQVVA